MKEGFKITKASDISTPLKSYRDNYNNKGKYLGWDCLNEHYSMQLGSVTDWTGYPMSGKTQVLMELLLNTSLYHGWRHLVYFPDVGSNIEIIADLMHKKTGKSFNPEDYNTITDAEINSNIDWLTHHFLILTKENVKAKLSPIEYYDIAVELKKNEGIHTCSVDSWKDFAHPYSEYGGYAQYLEFVLPYRNLIAEEHNLHIHTIIHPKLTDKDKNGHRKPPVPYDLKGGSEWFNSGKNMITVHREDNQNNFVKIIFNKIKPRSVGSIGEIELCFDLNRFVYYKAENVNAAELVKTYASKEGENKTESLRIEPNLNNQANIGFDDKKPKTKFPF